MTMLDIVRSSKFKKDLKKVIKQKKDIDMLEHVVTILRSKKALPSEYCDHNLTGEWRGYRECHINPDWLLIYKIDDKLKLLRLARTGSHSELFK